MSTIYFEDLKFGMSKKLTKQIREEEIQLFAELSEDRNPIHLCDEAAKKSIFGERIAHGMLSASLFSAIIGEQLPGNGSIYLSQNLRFDSPVKVGEFVTAEVIVSELNRHNKQVLLFCTAYVGDRLVIRGEALVKAPSRESKV